MAACTWLNCEEFDTVPEWIDKKDDDGADRPYYVVETCVVQPCCGKANFAKWKLYSYTSAGVALCKYKRHLVRSSNHTQVSGPNVDEALLDEMTRKCEAAPQKYADVDLDDHFIENMLVKRYEETAADRQSYRNHVELRKKVGQGAYLEGRASAVRHAAADP